MERTMLSVEQYDRGWAVSFKGLPLVTRITKAEAIEVANEHAYDRYSVTGQPVGVFVRMECGDEVLVGQHG
jgi:hypothetical protein